MKKLKLSFILAVAFLLLALTSLKAAPIYDTFGAEPFVDFDAGDGNGPIRNNRVAASRINVTGGQYSLFLTVVETPGNPLVTDNNAGTFYSNSGPDLINGPAGYAQWELGFSSNFISSSGRPAPGGLTSVASVDPDDVFIKLLYGPGLSQFQYLSLYQQGHWNPGGPEFSMIGFDPNTNTLYPFALQLEDSDHNLLGQVAVDNVTSGSTNNVPDNGSSLGLLVGACGLVLAWKRFMA